MAKSSSRLPPIENRFQPGNEIGSETRIPSFDGDHQHENGWTRCSRIKKNGAQCRRPAMKHSVERGKPLCHTHGGTLYKNLALYGTARTPDHVRATWSDRKKQNYARSRAKKEAEARERIRKKIEARRKESLSELHGPAVQYLQTHHPNTIRNIWRECIALGDTPPVEVFVALEVEKAMKLQGIDLSTLSVDAWEAIEAANKWKVEQIEPASNSARQQPPEGWMQPAGEGCTFGGVPYEPSPARSENDSGW